MAKAEAEAVRSFNAELEVSAVESAWSRSSVEEVIGALWALAAILCFGFDFPVAGWGFAIKSILDNATSIVFGIREAIEERKRPAARQEAAETNNAASCGRCARP